jgi:hypothetical protein
VKMRCSVVILCNKYRRYNKQGSGSKLVYCDSVLYEPGGI